MVFGRYCPSCLSSIASARVLASGSTHFLPVTSLLPIHQSRTAARSSNASRRKQKQQATTQKKKKSKTSYSTPDLRNALQFSLVDALRYLRAAEVGYAPTSPKYEIHLRLRTPKNGAVVRNRLRLPHPVKTDQRICVICPPDSAAARDALAAGASIVGEESVFDAVKAGEIPFERCVAHVDSVSKLAKSGVARILGPRGLMPSTKMGTVVKDVGNTVRDMAGGTEYRERLGVLRVAIGQLGFTPEEMQSNIRAFIEQVKKDITGLSDRISKDIHEVVLSSTHGPGLTLNGDLRGEASLPTKDLSTF